jgi:hypothetical protein
MIFTKDEINLLQYIIKMISEGMIFDESLQLYKDFDIPIAWDKEQNKIFNSLKNKIKGGDI